MTFDMNDFRAGHPWVAQFAGQASPWRNELNEFVRDARICAALGALERDAEHRISAVLPELTVIGAGPLHLLDDSNPIKGAFASVPGIVLAQYGAYLDVVAELGTPTQMMGHSQGVLAAALVEAEDRAAVFALARLIGAAATTVTRECGAERCDDATAMASVRNVPLSLMERVRGDADIAIVNARDAIVVAGRPAELARVKSRLEKLADQSAALRATKRTGGEPLRPIVEYLDVDAPFHSHLLEPAVALVDEWCARCGLNVERADFLARSVLTEPLNWRAQMRLIATELVASGKPAAVVDLGPGNLQRITVANIAGTGITYINAGTAAARDELMAGAPRAVATQDWRAYTPQLARIEGRTVLETAFTRLTGRSPIILGGMTPTTVDPEIVAAAANAGHWVELAGGGQVTDEVLAGHLAELKRLLQPGRTAEFNAMFLDRYLWDLHFGARRVVSRERAAGAPLDGVTISAGIPDREEAEQLIVRLRAEGFPYVAFKPGTVAQIRQVVDIAQHVTGLPLIIQVEDGHAGGHHSWVDLDELLLATYDAVRSAGIVLAVGGGLGLPERAADYLTGEWSAAYGMPPMPVDAVFIGTAAMTAREAKTNRDVKELLVATPGVAADDAGGWVASGAVRGGMTSGLSQLRADIYQVENSAAAAGRLLVDVDGDAEAVSARRAEIVAAINKTAKPFFGELEDMTYLEVLERYTELTYPWTDPGQISRLHDMLQRFEARLCPKDHGEWPTLFPKEVDVAEPVDAVHRFATAYPQAANTHVIGADAAWFVALCRKYPKPVPFVPVIGPDILQWWGSDSLWQSQDPRYSADQVRIIPGPVSVAAIHNCDEPVATILARYEDAAVARIAGAGVRPHEAYSRLAEDRAEYIRTVPFLMWRGQLATNPAAVVPQCELRDTPEGVELYVPLDTFWDGTEAHQHAVQELRIPLTLPESVHTGGLPVVDDARLAGAMRELLAAIAGVGTATLGGTPIEQLPVCAAQGAEAQFAFAVSETIAALHAGVTAPEGAAPVPVPSALLGSCWPTIYAAIGSGTAQDYPVIEGLLSAVHLDHSERLYERLENILAAGQLTARSRCASIEESSAGRIVQIDTYVTDPNGSRVLEFMDRFAMRGRVESPQIPREPAPRGGCGDAVETPRSILRRVTVVAPSDMTAFAIVSGDFNPIHTSLRAARVAGMDAPLVHGMWLCAAAQHAVSDVDALPGWRITGWTYRMFGMVNLGATVDITVERTGRIRGGGLALEVTCRIGGDVVSQATATVAPPLTAYVYPGQGIQAPGMSLDERASSPAAREVWERADRHTRRALGFSILAVVRDNPTELTARGVTYRHPQGVLNLTQFTQVALAVVAIAQTERLREAGALVDGAFFAGHSLGEYTALSAYGRIFTLENVLEIVFQRGSTMHHLVPRDENGQSNYRLGALRPNHMGLHANEVVPYVAAIGRESGEFLEVVNLNLAGQQYAIAGTVAGLAALARDAELRAERAGGKRPFMLIPGIDVPFHSSVLRPGVPDFRELLVNLLPQDVHVATLEGRYIPNLVARPFELTREFCEAILDVVPSVAVADLRDNYAERIADRNAFARILLVELLAWQFASPVRWIETQDTLIRSGVEEIVEVGLAASPTLANLAARTVALPPYEGAHIAVLNVQRDAKRVLREDVAAPVRAHVDTAAVPENTSGGTPQRIAAEGGDEEHSATAAGAASPVSDMAPERAAAPATERTELPFTAADALRILLAQETKMRPEQMTATDSVETLTNGVSSKRNQILMDMTAEFELTSLDGAADASLESLFKRVDAEAHSYRPFGPILSDTISQRLHQRGIKSAAIAEHAASVWGLPTSWVHHIEAEIALGTREGKSTRGGQLATLPEGGDIPVLVDAAIECIGDTRGITVAKQRHTARSTAVDSAALDAFADHLTGALADTARDLLRRLGVSKSEAMRESSDDSSLREAMNRELGSSWEDFVRPAFDPRKAVHLNDRWATAREDLARIAAGSDIRADFTGVGEEVARQAQWYAQRHPERAEIFSRIAAAARSTLPGPLSGRTVVVTGATAHSIAGSAAGELLAGGATVILTASRVDTARLNFAKELYRSRARADAELWLVPANMASFHDIDVFAAWLAREQRTTIGAESTLLKQAMTPDILLPFAAPRVHGSMDQAGPESENQARVLLWGVERLIGALCHVGAEWNTDHRLHVVLPGSPNRGTFGGDGAYGEVKAAFDAIVNKWHREPWGRRTSLVHATIGWVRGTGLMSHNDSLVTAAEKAGVTTWSTEQIGKELVALCGAKVREKAASEPLYVDLTGGLDSVDLSALRVRRVPATTEADRPPAVKALPSIRQPRQVDAGDMEWSGVTAHPEDMVVVVGIGEVGPWGSARTRFEAELGIRPTGEVELTAAGVLELAWMMGLLTWHDTPQPGWYDAADHLVEEAEIWEKYRDEVVARCGIRTFSDDGPIAELSTVDVAAVRLENDVMFTVKDEATALAHVAADPDSTVARFYEGEWQVTRKAGSISYVPRRTTLSRTVGGQFPDGFDPAHWGIPASMTESMDRMATWNLVTTVDAFVSAGFSPNELLSAVHPADVASTQGTGFGGMTSMRKLYVDRFLGNEYPQDILQETLPNVVAAHTMQSYVGGYGSMVHPVGACATAAVSVEEGVDKIAAGKARFVVAGAIDDLQIESLIGFGDMNATADSEELRAQGIPERFFSRAGDARRGGFVESQGGGTVLLARGDLARDLGLPVLAVVGYVHSYADGIHTSIPAPGQGIVAAARGGKNSQCARALQKLGVAADDIAVVSKHDTSTHANDPNEATLHVRIARALERTPGNPLYVISQKSLTGHAKGGAALFQMAGVAQLFESGVVPGNAALDCQDEEFAGDPFLVWPRTPLRIGAPKAAMLTSLGFGHVAALVTLVHPGAFEAAVARSNGVAAAERWKETANRRLRKGARQLRDAMVGRSTLFEGRSRIPQDDEIALLLADDSSVADDAPQNR